MAEELMVVPEEVTRNVNQLPSLLLSYLEREFYDEFHSRSIQFASQISGDPALQSRFLEIKEVKHTCDLDRSLHPYNMQNVISSLRGGGYGLAYLLRSKPGSTKLYMGVRQVNRVAIEPERQADILHSALKSNYPGLVASSDLTEKTDKDNLPLTRQLIQDSLVPLSEARYCYAVTGIPSLRGDAKSSFAQSIDRLADALRGEDYSLLIVAEPISEQRIKEMMANQRNLVNDVHRLVKGSIQISEGLSVGDTISVSSGLAFFLSASVGKSRSESRSANKTVVQEVINKTAEACEKLLDQHYARLQSGRNYGFWTTGIYIGSNSESTAVRLQSVVRSIFSGDKTHFEPLRIVDVSDSHEARESIYYLRNPIIQSGDNFFGHPLGSEFDTLATPLTTEEVSILMSLPNREVPGLKLSEVADFNLNPPEVQGVKLGNLLYRGEELSTPIAISSQSLTRHTFVTGLTGSGKTNTCLALLADAYQNKRLNFLVIDPAKTEYRLLMQDEIDSGATELNKNLLVFTLGEETSAPFRLNPFEFERGFPLLTHIDLLKAVFNAAFPMYASMPMILEEAILKVYTDKGWNITNSTNRFIKEDDQDYTPYLPRLSDLYAKIDMVVKQKGYDERLRNDLTAALKTRLGSLMNGGKGRMLDCQKSIPMQEILNRPVILELRRVGDDDEKAFLMSLLFIHLYEATQSAPPDGKLRHVTLIEEAHRLLRNIPVTASAESANPRGKAIETFTDMMAEMRAHGEGFIIVDQMPGKLVPDVVKGSNLKIVHRLLAQDDRQSVGNAMGLKPPQIEYLPRLTVGQAVIHSEELGEACLVKIDSVEEGLVKTSKSDSAERFEDLKKLLRNRFLNFKRQKNLQGCYQQFLSCVDCDNPCNYTPENNRWGETHKCVELGKKFISILVAGRNEDLSVCLEDIQSNVVKALETCYNRTPQRGEVYCAYIHLARRLRSWLTQYYQQTPLPVLNEFEHDMSELLWKYHSGDVRGLSSFLLGLKNSLILGVMKTPQKVLPGCDNCPVPCLFGHAFQTEGNVAVKKLIQVIESRAIQKKPNKYFANGNLSKEVHKHLNFNLSKEMENNAAYCWLAHSTKERSIYSRFWKK
jgi:hypothetical protein